MPIAAVLLPFFVIPITIITEYNSKQTYNERFCQLGFSHNREPVVRHQHLGCFFPLLNLEEVDVVLQECVPSHKKLVINGLVNAFVLEVSQELH